MKLSPITTVLTITALLSLFPIASWGRDYSRQSGSPTGGHHGPPPEAFAACEEKEAGEQAQFVSPRGHTINGTCQEIRGRLVLVPDTPPLRPGNGHGQVPSAPGTVGGSTSLIDTGQDNCYDENGVETGCPDAGEPLYGQDAQYNGIQPSYSDNGDGTITDTNTGLMWQQDPGAKMTYNQAVAGASSFDLAGYDDWRLPTIKELYALILFSGTDPSGCEETTGDCGATPFLDTDTFVFEYGDTSSGERLIDAQYASATTYVSQTMHGDETLFGVNFADGRIKGYGMTDPGSGEDKLFFVLYVRGETGYGENTLEDNGDGTISDLSTGLMWMQDDSGSFGVGDEADGALNWEQALTWAEDLEYGGYSDWRLPNAKELQNLVDYSRSPATSGTAAIDPLFTTTQIIDESGADNFPFYWTSTTHASLSQEVPGANAVYIAFGEALGWMPDPFSGQHTLLDVHGAGAQRSDPKVGDPAEYPYGRGPQGDVIRIYNYVRCVRDM